MPANPLSFGESPFGSIPVQDRATPIGFVLPPTQDEIRERAQASVAEYMQSVQMAREHPAEANWKRYLISGLEVLDTPRNVVHGALYSGLRGESMGRAISTAAGYEHEYRGVDIVNEVVRKLAPGLYKDWMLERIERLQNQEVEGRTLLSGLTEPVGRTAGPLGWLGGGLGFALDVVVDPLIFVGAVPKGVAKAAGAAKGVLPFADEIAAAALKLDPGARAAANMERRLAEQEITAQTRTVVDLGASFRRQVEPLAAREAAREAGQVVRTVPGIATMPLSIQESVATGKRLLEERLDDKVKASVARVLDDAAAKVDDVGVKPGLKVEGGLRFDTGFGRLPGEDLPPGIYPAHARAIRDSADGPFADWVRPPNLSPEERALDSITAVLTDPKLGAFVGDALRTSYDEVADLFARAPSALGEAADQAARAKALRDTPLAKLLLKEGDADAASHLYTADFLKRGADVLGEVEDANALLAVGLHQGLMPGATTREFGEAMLQATLRATARDSPAGHEAADLILDQTARRLAKGGLSEQQAARMAPGLRSATEAAENALTMVADVGQRAKDLTSRVTPYDLLTVGSDFAATSYTMAKTIRWFERIQEVRKLGVKGALASGDDQLVLAAQLLEKHGRGLPGVKELDQLVKNLHEAHQLFVTEGRQSILTAQDLFLGAHAMGPVTRVATGLVERFPIVGKAIGNIVRTESGPNPLFKIVAPRSPEYVFRGTGVYEDLYNAHKGFHGMLHKYGSMWTKSVMGEGGAKGARRLSGDERVQLGRWLDGQITDADLAKFSDGQDLLARGYAARGIFKEIADVLGIPEAGRISEYLPRIWDRDGGMKKALSEGYLPPELARHADVIQHALRASDVGKAWASKHVKKRMPNGANQYLLDADDAFHVYLMSTAKAHWMAPAFQRSSDTVNALYKAGRRDKSVVEYLKYMEDVTHGRPTKWDAAVKNMIDGVRDTLGKPELDFADATKTSLWLTMGAYRSNIAMSLPTWIGNLAQVVNVAGEHGPLSVLRPIAQRTVRRVKGAAGFETDDPMVALLTGELQKILPAGTAAEQAAAKAGKLKMQVTSRATSDYADLYEVAVAGKVGNRRIVHAYDKAIFSGMEMTENFNRGIALHAGMSQAQKEGRTLWEMLKYGQHVSDETQFVYGLIGRGPLYYSTFFRPLISPFTTYPQKQMAFLGGLMARNPTALMRYVALSGKASTTVSQMDLDPDHLLPWAFFPSKYQWMNGSLTPAMRFLAASGAYAKGSLSGDDEGVQDERALDMIESALSLTHLPMNLWRQGFEGLQAYSGGKIMTGGESTAALVRQIPGLGDMFLDTHKERVLIPNYHNEGWEKHYKLVARMLGFGDIAERTARQFLERAREDQVDAMSLSKRFAALANRDVDSAMELSEKDWETVNSYARRYGMEAAAKVFDPAKSARSILEGRHDHAARPTRQAMQDGMAHLMRTDPEQARRLGVDRMLRDSVERRLPVGDVMPGPGGGMP